MFEQYQNGMHYKSRPRQIYHALVTLAAGVLTLIFPNFLYLIAGVYLISLGATFLTLKLPSAFAAPPIVAGLLIIIFPDLIPITFASFLGLFGLMMLFAMQLAILGVITLIIAVLIIMNPDSVAYLIAFFMLSYSVSNLLSYYRHWKETKNEFDDDSVTIE